MRNKIENNLYLKILEKNYFVILSNYFKIKRIFMWLFVQICKA